MLGRLSKSWPYVPYESGKYILLLLTLFFILKNKVNQPVGLVMFSLLLPGAIIDLSDKTEIKDFIFNGLYPLCVAICISFLHKFKINIAQLDNTLRLIWLASMSALVYTFLKTPDFEDINFSLNAQYQTTAEHSSNQVSTVFGLGVFLSSYSILFRKKFSGSYLIDVIILCFFLFQGLLTFSRGGVLVGVFCSVIMFIYFNVEYIKRNFFRVAGITTVSIIIATVTFNFVDRLSGGKLLLRYQGETEGTLAGSKEKSFDVVVTNRASIFLGDIDLFLENSVLGVGVGASKYLRKVRTGEQAHVEFSRLLAENGILGLLYFILLVSLFYSAYLSHWNIVYRGLFLVFFLLALLTSFHAAMRTFVSPLFYLLSMMSLGNEK